MRTQSQISFHDAKIIIYKEWCWVIWNRLSSLSYWDRWAKAALHRSIWDWGRWVPCTSSNLNPKILLKFEKWGEESLQSFTQRLKQDPMYGNELFVEGCLNEGSNPHLCPSLRTLINNSNGVYICQILINFITLILEVSQRGTKTVRFILLWWNLFLLRAH